MDPATLHQMADATQTPLPVGIAVAGAAAAWKSQDSLSNRRSGEHSRGDDRNQMHLTANHGYDQYLHSNSNSRSGHSGSRLPTIPASPYIEQPEFVESPVVYQPVGPSVPEHSEIPQTLPSEDLAYRQRPDSSGSQLHRKPVPVYETT